MNNEIGLFFHCAKCLDELPVGSSPRDYGSIEAGWTVKGIQVWCKRHESNVVHIDFLGNKVSFAEEEDQATKEISQG